MIINGYGQLNINGGKELEAKSKLDLNKSASDNSNTQNNVYFYGKRTKNCTYPYRVQMNRTQHNFHFKMPPAKLLMIYSDAEYIKNLVDKNPKITKMLAEKGAQVDISTDNVRKICNEHITTTKYYALKIANQMKLNTKDKEILEWASVFHDFGKMLMPKEIINKPGRLDPKEREIINLHAELGYELLKNTSITGRNDIDKRIIDLVKNHHNPMENKGDVLCQILSVADIYSALREKRSYKDQMPVEKALEILDQKAKNGEVSTEVVNALREVTETQETI